MKGHDETVVSVVSSFISRTHMRTSYALKMQYGRHKHTLFKGFTVSWKFATAFVLVMLFDQYYVTPRMEAYTTQTMDYLELANTHDIYTSPLLKVRSSNQADIGWLAGVDYTEEEFDKLQNVLGNVAGHKPELFHKYMNVTKKDVFDSFCTIPDAMIPEKDVNVLNERGLFLHTKLIGETSMDFEATLKEVNRLSGASIRIFSSPSECCFACSITRSCNMWTYCPQETDMGDPTTCAGQCFLKHIEDPSMKAVNHPGKLATEFTSHAKIEQKGPKVPWMSGVLDKGYVPEDVTFETGTSGLLRKIALPLFEDIKGARPIIIDLLPERSPSSARYLTDIAKMTELTDIDPCLECKLTSRDEGSGLYGRIHGAMVPLGKSPPIAMEELSEDESDKDMVTWDVAWVPDASGRPTTEIWIVIVETSTSIKRHGEIVWGKITDKMSQKKLIKILKNDNSMEAFYKQTGTEMADNKYRGSGNKVHRWKLKSNYDFTVLTVK